jgi:hypothetical protein
MKARVGLQAQPRDAEPEAAKPVQRKIELQYKETGDREWFIATDYYVTDGVLSYVKPETPKSRHFLALDVLRALVVTELD